MMINFEVAEEINNFSQYLFQNVSTFSLIDLTTGTAVRCILKDKWSLVAPGWTNLYFECIF